MREFIRTWVFNENGDILFEKMWVLVGRFRKLWLMNIILRYQLLMTAL